MQQLLGFEDDSARFLGGSRRRVFVDLLAVGLAVDARAAHVQESPSPADQRLENVRQALHVNGSHRHAGSAVEADAMKDRVDGLRKRQEAGRLQHVANDRSVSQGTQLRGPVRRTRRGADAVAGVFPARGHHTAEVPAADHEFGGHRTLASSPTVADQDSDPDAAGQGRSHAPYPE